MTAKRLAFLLLILLFAGCSSNYAQLNRQISRAITPGQIINTGTDIAVSDLSDKDKRKLSVKLIKKTLNVFRLYVEFALTGDKLPAKDEIVSMLKFLAANADKFTEERMKDQAAEIAEKLSLILMSLYLDGAG